MLTSADPWTDPELARRDDAWFDDWRGRELARVDAAGLTYLDYTGSALAPASLVRRDLARLTGSVLGNPHSEHPASRTSSDDIAAARTAILAFLSASPEEYAVVLTANASAAMRLVGEGFRFGPASPLVMTVDNHNSVVGIREYARRRGAPVRLIGLDDALRADPSWSDELASGGLLAFPAQSNFSGVRHPLDLISAARSRGMRVLLDAAAYVPTATLDLGLVSPDYVALSLYKIAGWPGGLGALVARHDALAELERPWFAGGTVEWVTHDPPRHLAREGSEGFEDGTPPFLAAGAVPSALAAREAVGRDRLARHLASLTARCLDGLGALQHANGAAAAVRYGPCTTVARGSTIAINLLGVDGSVIPHRRVERRAGELGLAVRGGCFCNPGAAARAFGWSPSEVTQALDGLGRTSSVDALHRRLPGRAVGAIRLSLGLGSVAADVDRALEVLERVAREARPD